MNFFIWRKNNALVSRYLNYIIHCKIRRDNHQVPKMSRYPRIKQILRKYDQKFTNNASNYWNKYRIYRFITLFENFLFSLKNWFIKSFSRKNIFNSCIENICISVCIKWITAKKKSYFFWILSTIKMKFGSILVCCMTKISKMFLAQCWTIFLN